MLTNEEKINDVDAILYDTYRTYTAYTLTDLLTKIDTSRIDDYYAALRVKISDDHKEEVERYLIQLMESNLVPKDSQLIGYYTNTYDTGYLPQDPILIEVNAARIEDPYDIENMEEVASIWDFPFVERLAASRGLSKNPNV
jgi:hypothetical protein